LGARDGRLHTVAAPSLPDFFNAAVDGLLPGPGQGSCGAAAWGGEPVIASDIAHHPDWAEHRELAARAGLAACWSQPYLDEHGQVLGTFAIYHHQPLAPTTADLRLMEEFARLTALAETKVRDRERLRQAAEAIAATRDGVVITDLTPRIVAINPAYTEITGYTEAEVLAQNPNLVKSGRHDQAFYQALWQELQTTGHWQGEIWNRRKSGEIYPQWLSISTVRNERGEPTHYVGVFTDISHIKDAEARLEHLAHHDPLTDLPNRLLVLSRLNAAIERALRQHRRLAVLYIDLDDFKTINDSLGHPAGDQVLVVIAHRLRARLREQDTVARLGGDEFLVLLEDLESVEDAARVAQALIDLCAAPIALNDGQEMFVGLSIGISLCPDNAEETTTLIQYADAAMYQAKREGRNTYRFHTAALTEAAAERLRLETHLRHALDRHELVLHYQPLLAADGNRPMGVEALLRWQPPGEPLVPPGRFIPVAEASGLIVRMGAWALREACLQAQRWRAAGLAIDTLAVNLSARQFQGNDLVGLVQACLAESGLPPHCLELELTESILMEHEEDFLGCLDRLKAQGVRLAIDDFGTGYSSLAYLKRFPIDKLKIDQSFVRGLVDSADDREIAATIVAMGRNLHLEVLAEGVETEAQRDILVKLGCNAFQGFLFSRPLPAEALEAWWRERAS
jgi:diguanylate cyclase (GGDEF)-like protein/PAS domain S-box-containing protein